MTRRAHDDWAVAAAWQCASVLLDYPGSRDIDAVQQIVPHLPPDLRMPLVQVLQHIASHPLGDLQESYVATFDAHRRCNLFLTYFAHGDTRKRGAALLRFKQTYGAGGMQLRADELPDHLCVVLEFAATVDLDAGRQLLLDHRAGIEVLRMSLRDAGSPWSPVLDVVCAPLPPLRGDEQQAVRRLIEEGPPGEKVGLSPYGAIDLPMPTVLATRPGA